MKKSVSLIALNEIEVERTSQAQIRAGVIDPNPEEDDKCACLCSPGTDRGWREEYKKNNPPT